MKFNLTLQTNNREIRKIREQAAESLETSPLSRISCGSRFTVPVPTRNRAFTLIELLAVITIIGILSALVVGLASMASAKKKIARVDAEKQKLLLVIEAYHAEKGFYPPDGVTNNIQASANTNQLLYELTGTTSQIVGGKRQFSALNVDNSMVTSDQLFTFFGKRGFANSTPSPTEPQNFYKQVISASQHTYYDSNPANTNVHGLLVPVDLVSGQPNFWYYDSSSTNRHNPESFDLWAVYSTGKNTNVISGNWTQQ